MIVEDLVNRSYHTLLSMAEINRKSTHSFEVLPLDDNLFQPTTTELDFLKAAVDQDEHGLREKVLAFQRRAYNESPYLCIRAFHFVSLIMSKNPAYSQIIEAGKSSQGNNIPIFLDLGCCMGSDVRKLALDGYPANHIVGCDLSPTYISLGRELYQDFDETCPIQFITGDIFDLPLEDSATMQEYINLSEITALSQLRSRVKYIYVGAVFHLFDEPAQLALARRLARLISREKGTIIFGRHQGLENPSSIDDRFGFTRPRFGHSPDSWSRLWQDVFTETDGETYATTQVLVNAVLSEPNALRGIPIVYRQLTWGVHLI